MRAAVAHAGNALIGVGLLLALWSVLHNRPTADQVLIMVSFTLLALGSLFKCLGGKAPHGDGEFRPLAAGKLVRISGVQNRRFVEAGADITAER